MKNSLILTSLLIGALALTGCGSDSDSDGGTSGGSTSTGGASSSFHPVSSHVSCDPEAQTYSGATFDIKYYSEGDIEVDCSNNNSLWREYKLKDGVDTLTITQLIKEDVFNYNTNKGSGSKTESYDYQAGTIHYISTGMESFDCIETYPSILPFTISSDSTLSDLLEWEGDSSYNMISTTCPDSWYDDSDYDDDDDDDDNFDTFSGTVRGGTNYTLTDSNGKTHLLSEEASLEK